MSPIRASTVLRVRQSVRVTMGGGGRRDGSSVPGPWGEEQSGPPTMSSVARLLCDDGKGQSKAKNVVILAGAGISTASGIPDFRSPKTGLYANLKKYNLPYPEAIFDIDYFQRKPQAFFTLSKELYPGNFQPTLTHAFLKLLDDKGKLLRVFTQNIDTLERMAGLSADRIVEAHGSFASSRCIRCKKPVEEEWMREKVMSGHVARCPRVECRRKTDGQGGLVKPDIVFFGEGLPERFFERLSDLHKADLLIVVGTSLQVHPFASLVDKVRPTCPRILINLERVGEIASSFGSGGSSGLDRFFGGMRGTMNETGFDFDGCTLPPGKGKEQIRDVFYEGKCDEGVAELVKELGWDEELRRIHKRASGGGKMDDAAAAAAAEAPLRGRVDESLQRAEKKAEIVAKDIVATAQKDKDDTSAQSSASSIDKLADKLSNVKVDGGNL